MSLAVLVPAVFGVGAEGEKGDSGEKGERGDTGPAVSCFPTSRF